MNKTKHNFLTADMHDPKSSKRIQRMLTEWLFATLSLLTLGAVIAYSLHFEYEQIDIGEH